jgi:hypothetical protein
MNSPKEIFNMRKLTVAVLCLACAGNLALAKEKDESSAPVVEKCPALQASTVFVADRGQKGSAEKLTQSHKNAEAQGWSFDEISLYTENNDLQGFYVTYTRPHPCNGNN